MSALARRRPGIRGRAEAGARRLHYPFDPAQGEVDLRYGFPAVQQTGILNLIDARTGLLEAKHRDPSLHSGPRAWLVGDDVVIQSGETQRLSLLGKREQPVIPIAEARLQIARCLFESGKHKKSRIELSRLGEGLTQDPRALLLKMRIAQAQGGIHEAALNALMAMSGGGLAEEHLPACLEAVRRRYPLSPTS